MLTFLIIFVWTATEYNLSVISQIGPSTGLSMFVPYSSLIIGGLLMIYYILQDVLKNIKNRSEV